MYIPCTKKQLKIPSLLTHFQLYHRMKYDIAKKLVQAIQNHSLHENSILFRANQSLGRANKRKN